MKSLTMIKKVQILNSRLAALNLFLRRSTGKCKPFLLDIKKNEANFYWNDECKASFQILKDYLASLPLLSKPLPDETLFLYLAVSDIAVRTTLVLKDRAFKSQSTMSTRLWSMSIRDIRGLRR